MRNKKVVRLTESRLRNIIAESVKRILIESSHNGRSDVDRNHKYTDDERTKRFERLNNYWNADDPLEYGQRDRQNLLDMLRDMEYSVKDYMKMTPLQRSYLWDRYEKKYGDGWQDCF